jgi:hypothetical protein
MLGITSELFPKGGAMLLGLMGTVGNLAIYYVLPEMGRISDAAGKDLIGGGMAEDLAKATGASIAFQKVALVPVVLLVAFGLVWVYLRSRGGYHEVRRREADAIQLGQADPGDFSADAVIDTDVAAVTGH